MNNRATPKTIGLLLLYVPLFTILYLSLFYFGFIKELPSVDGLMSFDVNYYAFIKDFGYQLKEGSGVNTGFFPLFAYLWRLSHLDVIGMSIFNTILFFISLFMLIKEFKIENKIIILFLCSPFTFFFFLPLSESLFFFCCTLFLIGLNRNNSYYVFFGLLLASVTRASFFFFIPAFIGSIWMINQKKDLWAKTNYRELLGQHIAPCILGLLIVILIQYLQTENSFTYFKIQTNTFGRKFAWPMFPLAYSSSHRVNAVSISSLWIGMLASFMSVYYLGRWIFRNTVFEKDRIYLFSLIFLSMATISIVFMNPTWNWYSTGDHKSTYINGINRYIFCNAFYLFFIMLLHRHIKITKMIIAGILGIFIFVLFINAPALHDYTCTHCIPANWVKLSWPIFFAAYLFSKKSWLLIPLSITGMIMQCYMLSYFLVDLQVD